jgi:hypothetical protein
MTPAVKIGIGAVATLAVIAGGAFALSGDDDDAQPSNDKVPVFAWSGNVGDREFSVNRNGSNWAWEGEGVGSGSESSGKAALLAVVRALVETAPAKDPVVMVALLDGHEIVRGTVIPLPTAWNWVAKPVNGSAGGHGDAPSRGVAVLELVEWLESHEDGAQREGESGPGEDDDEGEDEEPEVDPDADTVPIDVPPPDAPSNIHELGSADDLVAWGVAHALDPDGSQGPRPSMFVLAYDRGWIGRAQTLDEVRELAEQYPAVHFVLVSFEVTRAAFGEPSSPTGYVATAIGPDRRARAEQVVGRKKTLGPISVGRLVQLVRFAAHGAAENDERLFDAESADGTRYVIEVRHVKGGAAWEFLAWKGKLGDDEEAIERQAAPSVELALKAAGTWMTVRGLKPIGIAPISVGRST